MNEEGQPDPDTLLKAIQQEENKKKLGKLKIFFGMSAGVGKTYAMLEEAQRRLKDGVNIVIGTINTHGRKETEDLLKGLPIIPEKWIKYKDTVFEELDLETILQSKPTIVAVDELAHTNVPGSRHAKRWQDVIELLDRGIDVYTTLNVQHVESRKDLVESFAGIQIRETVPDLLLERASAIELIDISPEELLQRLKDGKVYLGNQSQIAANNFFKEDTLTALREIALRFTAEKVDHDLHSILSQGKGWKTREKLMVAISSSPSSQQLIRRTRRRAFELDAPWVAIYVDQGKILSDEEQKTLTSHLNLAQELGAEVVTTYDTDISEALQTIARSKNVTQLIVGHSDHRGLWNFFHKSLIDQIEEKNPQLDVVILRGDPLQKIYQGIFTYPTLTKTFFYEYGLVIASVIAIVLFGLWLSPFVGYKTVGHIFLLDILLLGFFVSPPAIFFAAIVSTLSWNFFFMPPNLSFALPHGEDLALSIIYFCTAAILGVSTSHIHKQDELLKLREKKLEHLYEIEKVIALSTNFQSLRMNISSHLQSIFNGYFDILIKNRIENTLIVDSQLPMLQDEKETATALWAYQNGKMVGWSTPTLPSAKGLYIPIPFANITLGVLAYIPSRERPLATTEVNFLQTVAQQIGAFLDRYLSKEQLENQVYALQAEKLHTSILQSISKEFRTPIHQIFEAVHLLQRDSSFTNNKSYVETIDKATKNVELMVNNLLASAELKSGFVKLHMNQHNIKEFIDCSLNELAPYLQEHPLQVLFPANPIFLFFDPRLMKISFTNILIYAATLTPTKKAILIEGMNEDSFFKIMLSMDGASLSQQEVDKLFEKSPHLINRNFLGDREGLILANSIIAIHGGKLIVEILEKKGVRISVFLPV